MIDYDGVGEQIRLRIANTVTAFGKNVYYEADERDYAFHNMPLCDVVLEADELELRAGQDYLSNAIYEITIACFNMGTYNEASLQRSTLLKATQNALRASPLIHVDLESIVLGAVAFSKAKDEKTGAWVASASLKLRCIAFVDRS